MVSERQREIRRRRQRRATIRKLRARWEKAADSERERILDKLWRINPEIVSHLTSKGQQSA